jgi:hypothetical protein
VNFGTITFPEIRLRMPSIELPHCFCGKSHAQMNLDAAVAPWESRGFVNTAPAATGSRAATPPENLPSPLEAQSRAAAERSACEEYSRKLQQYEDQLRRINEERRALEDCIRQCLETHRGASDNIPPAEMGCVGQPGANGRSAGANPYSQPMTPPQPTPDNARRMPPSGQFREQPASFTGPSKSLSPSTYLTEPRPEMIPAQPIQTISPAPIQPIDPPEQEAPLSRQGGRNNKILLEWLKTAPQTAYHSPCQ